MSACFENAAVLVAEMVAKCLLDADSLVDKFNALVKLWLLDQGNFIVVFLNTLKASKLMI